MKIIVCVKQVPDSAARVTVEDNALGARTVTWHDAPLVINPWDEYAVEAALVQKEIYGGDVIAVSIGPESAKEALKHALAMGCSEAVLVSDPGLNDFDNMITARLLAAAIQKIAEADLVVMGRQAIDDDLGITAAQVARLLGWPALTLISLISSIDPAARKIQVERATEEGRQVVESPLPAVISVVKDIGEPRYPSFMGIRKAQRAPIPTWSLADLGLAAEEPIITKLESMNPPQRAVVNEMITGSGPQEIAERLVEKILAEGVL